MEIKIAWQKGEGNIVVTEQQVSSDTANESVDREQPITYRTTRGAAISHVRTVRQEGKRERFGTPDGLFLLSGGGTFNVLKPEWGDGKTL